MKRIGVAACIATMPVLSAQAATPYVAVQGGGLQRVKANDIDEIADYAVTQSPSTPLVPAPEEDQEYDDVFSINYGKGYDAGLLGGYDFGWFRLEMELGHRKSEMRRLDSDDNAEIFQSSLNDALNRPSQSPDPGAPGLPALTIDDFDLDGNIHATSLMANAMVDIGVTKRFSAYLGYGYGRSWVKALGDHDSAWGWQRFYGVRYKVGDDVELGFKWRKITSGIVKLQADPVVFTGNPDRLTVAAPAGGSAIVDRTTNAAVVQELEGEVRTYSYLFSLFYNFR